MKLKPIQLVLILYFVPLLMATDCGGCGCAEYDKYNIVYKGVDFSAWDTSKFEAKEVEGEVSKNAFGIKISVKQDEIGIAFNQKSNTTSYASFGIAYAWSCSCITPEYLCPDPIKTIQVTSTDIATKTVVNVTDKFTAKNGDQGHTITTLLEDHKKQEYNYHIYWRLDLTDTTNIPETVIFTLTVSLDSGKTFTQETEAITFKA